MRKLDETINKLNSIMMNNFVYDNEFDFLYHYTDVDSAKLIIENGQFWVSDAFTTTDKEEIIHIKEIIDKIINTKYSFLETEKKELCTVSFQNACDLFRSNAFILCFSLIKDSIPLWKNYAKKDNKTGVCLRFDFKKITPNLVSELLSQERYFVDKNGKDHKIQLLVLNHFVTYDESIKHNKIEEYMDIVYDVIKQIPIDNFDAELFKEEINLLVEIFSDILLFAFMSKVSRFQAEREYRMIYLFHNASKFPLILKTRMRNDKEIRYVSTNMKAANTFSLNRIFVKHKKDIREVKQKLKPLITDEIKIKSI